MAGVKQVRVRRGMLTAFMLWALVLGLLRAQLGVRADALALGGVAGVTYGALRWWRLQRRIARRNRRYEPNKIFVDYLNSVELAVVAIAHDLYLLIPMALILLVAGLFATLSAYWWTVFGGSFGLVSMGVLSACVLCFERRHGPLYYQYKSDTWTGAEGLIYQRGTVVQPLIPAGKVTIDGVLWNAVSLSGETIEAEARVEVISIERLTLYVDRLPEPQHES
ncbi:hypothetical protein NKDENANG_01341 [Candidatus Entotheonellaceae bacterium PAL068K]